MSSIFRKTLIATSLSLIAAQAHSAGFQISEHSVSGLGRAFAGEAAIADSAAVGARNAAALTRFDSTAVSGGINFIDPDVHSQVQSAGNGTLTAQQLQALGMSTDASDIAPSEVVPNFHIVHPVNDKWALGLSTFSNFGLSTEFPENSAAGSIGGETKLITVNFNGNAAYKIDENWSIGIGLNGVYADADLTRYAGAGYLTSSLLNSPQDKAAELAGDGWGFGWNVGVLWELDEDNRFGLTYRSKVDITLEGDYKGISTILTGKSGQNVPGELELNLPEIAEFSGFHQLNDTFAVHYSVMYIGWDSFQELKATSSDCIDPLTNTAGQCLQKDEKWDNSWRYAIGATYTVNDQWALRAGFAYDESPVPAEHRTLSIPDSDRYWWSAGTTYAANDNLSLDFGFAFLNGDSVEGNEDGFKFTAGGDAFIYGAQVNYVF